MEGEAARSCLTSQNKSSDPTYNKPCVIWNYLLKTTCCRTEWPRVVRAWMARVYSPQNYRYFDALRDLPNHWNFSIYHSRKSERSRSTLQSPKLKSYALVIVCTRETVVGAKKGNGVAKDRVAQLWIMPLSCKLQGILPFTGHPHWPGIYVDIIISIWSQQYHRLLSCPSFLQSCAQALLLGKAVKMPHLPLPKGWCFSKATSSRMQLFWGWCLSIGALAQVWNAGLQIHWLPN